MKVKVVKDNACFKTGDVYEVHREEDVEHNAHYTALSIEPWDIMEQDFTRDEFIGFLKGNILKYLLREKGQDEADCDKIIVYAKKLKEVLNNSTRKEL